MRVKTNLVSGIAFTAISVVLLLLMPTQIIVSSIIPFLESAKAAPLMAILVMLIGGLILIFQSVVLKKETVVVINMAEQKYALIMIGGIILYGALIYVTGYIIASLVMVLSLYRFYKVGKPIQLAVTLVIVIFVYFLFTNVFNVSLPGFGGELL
jgi:putative tricarboxylic transport membrane protein